MDVKSRGATYESCNVKLQTPRNIIFLFRSPEDFHDHKDTLTTLRLKAPTANADEMQSQITFSAIL